MGAMLVKTKTIQAVTYGVVVLNGGKGQSMQPIKDYFGDTIAGALDMRRPIWQGFLLWLTVASVISLGFSASLTGNFGEAGTFRVLWAVLGVVGLLFLAVSPWYAARKRLLERQDEFEARLVKLDARIDTLTILETEIQNHHEQIYLHTFATRGPIIQVPTPSGTFQLTVPLKVVNTSAIDVEFDRIKGELYVKGDLRAQKDFADEPSKLFPHGVSSFQVIVESATKLTDDELRKAEVRIRFLLSDRRAFGIDELTLGAVNNSQYFS